ncbi:hypothetical protein C6A86_025770 [Mycobacterium sp. ITM-2016-00316]|uniref:DUF6779 domain-containing protein n=1 Tax=Mycobacterium sp. ITM-2016-00316 TaxID=2099695 RepID=UPI00287FD464|nr:DUF6779 domain-containing protein [Mycobacterium sp. ITM-2016-00316]WNG81540.1 hypothetical protein C6A86_025770 [Mycobacterium sp. ITM-2016-00316]
MTDPSRGVRVRRVNRRPGWVLLTALLVLAIVASTVLVFTNRVELLKLAVVLALWAAVAAAFVSFIYRRQSDLDQAKVRDLKYVYDLQLDREISARREYELAVEAQLRRELSAELRAQAADEVAALRAELAALRTNLEILFDTDLDHRPALETERPAGRVIASRVDTPVRAEFLPPPPRSAREPRTEESPIIDVPAEPHPPEYQWAPAEPVGPEPVAPDLFGGAHRRASDTEEPAPWQRRAATSPPPPPSPAAPPIPEPAAAQWSPPPTATWEPPPAPEPAPRAEQPAPETPERRGRHYGSDAESTPPPRRSRHAVPGETGPPPPRTRRAAQPDREPPAPPVPSPTPPQVPSPTPPPAARHRSAEELQRAAEQPEPEGGQHAGGQPVSELLSRLQATPTGGGRRRRREE